MQLCEADRTVRLAWLGNIVHSQLVVRELYIGIQLHHELFSLNSYIGTQAWFLFLFHNIFALRAPQQLTLPRGDLHHPMDDTDSYTSVVEVDQILWHPLCNEYTIPLTSRTLFKTDRPRPRGSL